MKKLIFAIALAGFMLTPIGAGAIYPNPNCQATLAKPKPEVCIA